jgi:hypothetical protein
MPVRRPVRYVNLRACEARIKRVRDTMDPITADCAILGLGRKYAKARDHESLGLGVKEIKEDQTETIAWSGDQKE